MGDTREKKEGILQRHSVRKLQAAVPKVNKIYLIKVKSYLVSSNKVFIKEVDGVRSIICFPPWKCWLFFGVTRVWRPIFTAFIIVVNVNRHCHHGNLFPIFESEKKKYSYRLSTKSERHNFLHSTLHYTLRKGY